MKTFACLLTVAQLIVSPAGAHSWYPKECCHNDDCHPVPCGELTTTRYGLSWKGVAVFSEPMIRFRRMAHATSAACGNSRAQSFLICRFASSCPRQLAECFRLGSMGIASSRMHLDGSGH